VVNHSIGWRNSVAVDGSYAYMNTSANSVAISDIDSRKPAPGSWRAASLCRQHPTDWWFAGGHHDTMLAKRICEGCVVRPQCLDFALGRPELLGVWAATTPTERAAIRRARDGQAAGERARVELGPRSPVDVDLVLEAGRESEPEPRAALSFVAEPEAAPEPAREPARERGRRRPGGPGERPELLTPAEAARLLGVTPNTVTRWSRAGKVSAIQTMGGHRRFRRSEVERVLRESNLPAPSAY
jgi:excisionase family DNA binding protein